MSQRKFITVFLVILFAFAISGCGAKFMVSKYPDFYKSSIKSLAVLPFMNETSHKGAGIAVATHVSAAFAANGTYKVTDPAKLDNILKNNNLPEISQDDNNAAAEELAKLGTYQAYLQGRVLSDSFINTVIGYYDNDDIFYDDSPYWNSPYWYPSYWYYPYYYVEKGYAYVSADVSIISIPDGSVLDTVNVKASVDESDSPELKRYTMQIALNKLADKIVNAFAIVPVEINVQPDKAMKTANAMGPGEWKYTKTFSQDQKSMFVVICLPESAAMNQFEIAITPRGKPSNKISSIVYTWEKGRYCQNVEFSPSQIARKNGPGNYSVQFISRGQIIFSRNFKIK